MDRDVPPYFRFFRKPSGKDFAFFVVGQGPQLSALLFTKDPSWSAVPSLEWRLS